MNHGNNKEAKGTEARGRHGYRAGLVVGRCTDTVHAAVYDVAEIGGIKRVRGKKRTRECTVYVFGFSSKPDERRCEYASGKQSGLGLTGIRS